MRATRRCRRGVLGEELPRIFTHDAYQVVFQRSGEGTFSIELGATFTRAKLKHALFTLKFEGVGEVLTLKGSDLNAEPEPYGFRNISHTDSKLKSIELSFGELKLDA